MRMVTVPVILSVTGFVIQALFIQALVSHPVVRGFYTNWMLKLRSPMKNSVDFALFEVERFNPSSRRTDLCVPIEKPIIASSQVSINFVMAPVFRSAQVEVS